MFPLISPYPFPAPLSFANRCCKLVSDYLPILCGSTSRRHRLAEL
jgi:hypothetical protein